MSTATLEATVPLCVDLDGTLLASDVLWESFLALVRQKPWLLPALPVWLLRGRAHLKRQLARHVSLDPASLPYDAELLEMLRAERAGGRELILATASDIGPASAVAAHLGIFSAVCASDGTTNNDGERKLAAIQAQVANGRFDYIGDSSKDLPVWRAARQAMLVDPSRRLLQQANKDAHVVRVFARKRAGAMALLRALRPHQWVKNTLLFVPLLLSHNLDREGLVVDGLLAFLAFCLSASSVYVTNDLLDLEADRGHPRKRLRPFAAGQLRIGTGVLMAPLLLVAAMTLAAVFLPPMFVAALVTYVVLSTAYSLYIKRVVLLDVFLLAALYTWRVLAGGVATGIVISPWLAAFSLFFFTSLAFLKRYSELLLLRNHQQHQFQRRDYAASDMDLLRSVGSASGFVSV
ncbi:MAG TPA: UbiA family prenyltransferase, partial [Longimicrobiales bacterium]